MMFLTRDGRKNEKQIKKKENIGWKGGATHKQDTEYDVKRASGDKSRRWCQWAANKNMLLRYVPPSLPCPLQHLSPQLCFRKSGPNCELKSASVFPPTSYWRLVVAISYHLIISVCKRRFHLHKERLCCEQSVNVLDGLKSWDDLVPIYN